MRKILSIILLLLSMCLPATATTVTLSSPSGHPGDVVDVTVTIADPGTATALELDIPLSENLSFVANSVVGTSSSAHSVSGNVKEGELRLIMHNLALQTLPSGELMKFSLKLGKKPGDFILSPKLILSDADGEKVNATVSAGTVRVLSPFIELMPTKVDFGRIPIRGSYTEYFTIRNSGNEPLTISGINQSAKEFAADQSLPLTIAAGDSRPVALIYSPTTHSEGVSENLTVVSNAINGNAILDLTAIPFSVNELHVAESLTGISDETVTVSLRLNNMEPIAGIQANFIMPEALSFVEGSAAGTGRGSNLSVTTSVNGSEMTLIAYSPSGKGLAEGDDNIITFDVKLNGRSGSYLLEPSKVILSNHKSENMTSATSGQHITINAPSISTESTLDFGNVAVGSHESTMLTVRNNGRAPLTIDRIDLSEKIFSIAETFPFVIPSYSSKDIRVNVSPLKEGKQTATANIYSNDPEQRLSSVTMNVNAYEANQLTLSGEPNDDYSEYTLHVGLDNFTEITALQMDIKWIDNMTTSQKDIKLSSRCSDHSSTVTSMGNGVYRIIIFSMTNTPFANNAGELFSLTYHGMNFTGTTLSAENIVLSSASGQNYTSPGSSISVVSVNDVKVSQINLSAASVALKASETATITAEILPTNAAVKSVEWKSSNPQVAIVNEEGEIIALSVGEIIITATAKDGSGVSAQCKVTVNPTPASGITLDKIESTLKVTETVQLTATVSPETTTDKTVAWSSSDTTVASVDNNGLVTAHRVGSATITAKCGGVTATCAITVVITPASGITLDKTESTLKVTEAVQLKANVSPETTTDKTVAWSSSDATVASVDNNGLVSAHKVGSATITAKCGDVTATCAITVVTTPASGITLDKTESTLKVTETVQLKATVSPETTTDKTVAWSSSDATVASVDNYGLVTAHKVGSATITAKCGGVTATCTLKIVPTMAERITLSQTTAQLKVGENFTLTATVLPETTTNKTVTWSSSDAAVAVVEANGKITALSLGNSIITARCGDVTANCSVAVVATPAESVTINHASVSLKSGDSVVLTATVLPENATDKTVVWISSNESVATVNADGKVTGIWEGEAAVTAHCGSVSASCSVTVEPTLAESITLNQTALSLKVGESVTLTATVLPESTTNKTVVWTSSNESIATVYPNGEVAAIALGTSVITAKCGEVSTDCIVTVVPTPAESLTLSQTAAQLKVGDSLTLAATVMPEDATDRTVVWTSSDKSVAIVDNNGNVIAVSIGDTEIIAQCGSLTATCSITVSPILVETITLTPATWSGIEGDCIQLVAVVYPENATSKSLNWTSSDEAVATVDSNGLVSIKAEGNCVITVSANDGSDVEAKCIVTGLSGVEWIFDNGDVTTDVYSLGGVLLRKGCDRHQLQQLAPGIYILQNRYKTIKAIVK